MSNNKNEIVFDGGGSPNFRAMIKMPGETSAYGFLSDKDIFINYSDANTNPETVDFFKAHPKAFIFSTNDCGCEEITKDGYIISFDPNKGTTEILFTKYNRGKFGEIIDEVEGQKESSISATTIVSVKDPVAAVRYEGSDWKKTDKNVVQTMKETNEGLLVTLYFQDNLGDKNSSLTFTFAKNSDGSGKYNETPSKAEVIIHKKDHKNAVKVEVPIVFDGARYKPLEETEITTTRIEKGEFEKITAAPKKDSEKAIGSVSAVYAEEDRVPLEVIRPVTYSGGVVGNYRSVDTERQPPVVKPLNNPEFDAILESMKSDNNKRTNHNAFLPKKPQQLGNDGSIINKI